MPKARGRGFKSSKHARDEQESQEAGLDDGVYPDFDSSGTPIDKNLPFFGILDRTELEYFKRTESTLAANVFEDDDMRSAFISGVLDESKGKELKLVTNAICSKLVERLILHASDAQLLRIFQSFNGHFVDLSKHKYSSHCLETLMIRSAELVEKEMRTDPKDLYPADNADFDQVHSTMTSLFMYMFNELEPQLQELCKNPYASHVIRVLLLVLSGSQLPSTTDTKSALRSKKSSALRNKIAINENDDYARAYTVPSDFLDAVTKALQDISAGFTVDSAREASIDKITSPVMQVVVALETKLQHGNGVVSNLLFGQPGDANKNSSEEAFLEYLLTDAVGVYFFESVSKELSSKRLQRLYTLYMADRLDKLVHRDCANYIFPVLLEKLKTDDKRSIIDAVIDNMAILLEQNKFVLVKSAFAACKPGHYREKDFQAKLFDVLGKNSNFLLSALNTTPETIVKEANLPSWSKETPDDMLKHRALFVESLIAQSPDFLNAAATTLENMDSETLVSFARHSTLSHVMECCLVPQVAPITRKKILNKFRGHHVELAKNVYGSHQVDKFWRFAYQQKHIREQIAQELATSEEDLKSSMYGRIVWRNWHMDKYARQRFQWWSIVNDDENKIKAELLGSAAADKPKPGKALPSKMHGSKPYDRKKDKSRPYKK